MTTVQLTSAQLARAGMEGQRRQAVNRQVGVRGRNGAPVEEGAAPRDVRGAIGEMAVAVHLGLTEFLFQLQRPQRDSWDLPPNIDVKSIGYRGHNLLVQCDDAPGKDYWLVYVGEAGWCEILGHAPRSLVERVGMKREPQEGRPCYVVPVAKLLPPTKEGEMPDELQVMYRTEAGEEKTAIVQRAPNAMVMGPAELELVRELICPQATAAELAVFGKVCLQSGLNPFMGQIWLIRRWDSNVGRLVAKPQTGIDGYRLIAQRSGKYRGQVPKAWCGDDGHWRDVWLSDQPPAAARAGVIHADYDEPLVAVARYSAYVPLHPQSGEIMGLWVKMHAEQLAKCAEALALRTAFPAETSNLYTVEEMEQAMSIAAMPTNGAKQLPAGLPDKGGTMRAGQPAGRPQDGPPPAVDLSTAEGVKQGLVAAATKKQGQMPARPVSVKQADYLNNLLGGCWPESDVDRFDKGKAAIEFVFGEKLNMSQASIVIEWLKSGDPAVCKAVHMLFQAVVGGEQPTASGDPEQEGMFDDESVVADE